MCSDSPKYVKPSKAELELVRQSDELWKQYQTMYIPLENKIIQQTKGKRSQGFQQASIDRSVNAARIHGKSTGTLLAPTGLNPGSAQFANLSNLGQQQTGTSMAMASTAGKQTAEDEYMSGMLGLSQQGRSQQSSAMQGKAQVASNQAGMNMAELAAKQYANASKWGAIGTTLGASGMIGYEKYKKPIKMYAKKAGRYLGNMF